MTTLFLFDLETAANLTPAKRERFIASARTGNLKDPAKIEAKIKDHVETCIENAALRPTTGRIVAASYCIVSTESKRSEYSAPSIRVGLEPDEERDVILDLLAGWEHSGAAGMVGFNIREFDIPFLIGRMCALNLLTYSIPRPRSYSQVHDLRDYLPNGTLAEWLEECGIPPKKGSGEMMAKWVEAGDRHSIIEYAGSEIWSMAELFHRVCRVSMRGAV